MKKLLSIIITAVMCLSMFGTALAAEMTFTDVHPEDWYYEDVKYAVENGLINGKSTLLFAPHSSLTNAEAVKLAACLNQLYISGSVSLTSGMPWYMPFVDYCVENGIIQKEYEWNRTITRGEFVIIFANTLPEDGYEQINEIEYGEIPDVTEDSEYYEAAYKLYRAGIITGTGEDHILRPESMIKRAEVAAIVTRMVDETRRVEFSFEKREDEIPNEENKENEDVAENDNTAENTEATENDGTTEEDKTSENSSETENNVFVNTNVVIMPENTDNTQGNVNITDGTFNENANSSDDDDIIYGEVKTNEDEKNEYVVVNSVQNTEVVNGQPLTNLSANIMLALSIKLQPTSFKVTEFPARASFVVEAIGGTGPYTYQWEYQEGEMLNNKWIKLVEPVKKRGMPSTAYYSGSTTNTLKVAATEDNADVLKHKFRCVITDANGNKVTSDVVGFEVGELDLNLIRKLR